MARIIFDAKLSGNAYSLGKSPDLIQRLALDCDLMIKNKFKKGRFWMAKSDYPALLAPGVHALTISALYDLAVAPFPSDVQRLSLFNKFTKWANALQALGISGTMWLDGSFLTEKVAPSDIDCVLWNPKCGSPNSSINAVVTKVEHLLDHATARAIYDLDLYIESPQTDQQFHKEAYWKGVFGYCHDRVSAKGFVEVKL